MKVPPGAASGWDLVWEILRGQMSSLLRIREQRAANTTRRETNAARQGSYGASSVQRERTRVKFSAGAASLALVRVLSRNRKYIRPGCCDKVPKVCPVRSCSDANMRATSRGAGALVFQPRTGHPRASDLLPQKRSQQEVGQQDWFYTCLRLHILHHVLHLAELRVDFDKFVVPAPCVFFSTSTAAHRLFPLAELLLQFGFRLVFAFGILPALRQYRQDFVGVVVSKSRLPTRAGDDRAFLATLAGLPEVVYLNASARFGVVDHVQLRKPPSDMLRYAFSELINFFFETIYFYSQFVVFEFEDHELQLLQSALA